jgi:hypothetical protein
MIGKMAHRAESEFLNLKMVGTC